MSSASKRRLLDDRALRLIIETPIEELEEAALRVEEGDTHLHEVVRSIEAQLPSPRELLEAYEREINEKLSGPYL